MAETQTPTKTDELLRRLTEGVEKLTTQSVDQRAGARATLTVSVWVADAAELACTAGPPPPTR
jgi:hypothetical protein